MTFYEERYIKVKWTSFIWRYSSLTDRSNRFTTQVSLHPFAHTFIHRWQRLACKVAAHESINNSYAHSVTRATFLAQGHFNTLPAGVEDLTTISGRPLYPLSYSSSLLLLCCCDKGATCEMWLEFCIKHKNKLLTLSTECDEKITMLMSMLCVAEMSTEAVGVACKPPSPGLPCVILPLWQQSPVALAGSCMQMELLLLFTGSLCCFYQLNKQNKEMKYSKRLFSFFMYQIIQLYTHFLLLRHA